MKSRLYQESNGQMSLFAPHKEKQKVHLNEYIYEGPVFGRNREFLGTWTGITRAKTELKAASNFMFRIKMDIGLPANARIFITNCMIMRSGEEEIK